MATALILTSSRYRIMQQMRIGLTDYRLLCRSSLENDEACFNRFKLFVNGKFTERFHYPVITNMAPSFVFDTCPGPSWFAWCLWQHQSFSLNLGAPYLWISFTFELKFQGCALYPETPHSELILITSPPVNTNNNILQTAPCSANLCISPGLTDEQQHRKILELPASTCWLSWPWSRCDQCQSPEALPQNCSLRPQSKCCLKHRHHAFSSLQVFFLARINISVSSHRSC